MTPDELHRYNVFEQIQHAKADAGRVMKLIVEVNAQKTHTEGEEKIRLELLGFAAQLLKTYNDSTTRLLQQWEALNP